MHASTPLSPESPPPRAPAVPIPPLDLQGVLGHRDVKPPSRSAGARGPAFATVGSITHAVLGALREARTELKGEGLDW